MPRSLDQIIKELDAGYNPSRQLINQKIAALPSQADAEIGGLQAQQGQAFNDIVAGARDRGLGFSGIPIAEQAKYTSSQFLPAVARVRQSQNEAQSSLTDALNQTNLEQRKTAMGLYQQELDRAEAQRQFDQQLRASRAASGGGGGYGGGYLGGDLGAVASGGGMTPQGAQMINKGAGKGFAFTNQYGNPISAAQFAAAKKIPFRDLLGIMAKQGDAGARVALGFVGNDYGYDPNRIGKNTGLYNSLVWGTGKGYTPAKAQPKRQKSSLVGSRIRR